MASTKYGTGNNSPIAVVNKRQPVKRKPSPRKPKKKKGATTFSRLKWIIAAVIFVGAGVWFGITFQEGIKYFFSAQRNETDEKSFFDFRTVEVLQRHSDRMIGFDVSHYQGVIDWKNVDSVAQRAPLEFVFVRATMGDDGKDRAFELNWKGARANHFIRGAYHYYRPDENSSNKQKTLSPRSNYQKVIFLLFWILKICPKSNRWKI